MAGNSINNIKKGVKKFVTEEFLPEGTYIKDDELLFDIGIIDSLGLIKLTAFIEENFGVIINPRDIDMDDFNTIEKIARFVNGRKKENG